MVGAAARKQVQNTETLARRTETVVASGSMTAERRVLLSHAADVAVALARRGIGTKESSRSPAAADL